MSLSCHCDMDDCAWYYSADAELKPLSTKRARRCCSCGERIAIGDECKAFYRWRTPDYDTVEERIYGEGGEVPLATWYMCERCADLHDALDELGFCSLIGEREDMRELCREYAQMQRDAGVFRGALTTANAEDA